MNVTSGVDWFDLSGTLELRRHAGSSPRNPRSPPSGTALREAQGRLAGHPAQECARFASMAELGKAEGEAIRFRSSQALLLDALLAAQDQVTVDAPFAAARETPIFQRRRPGRRAAGLPRRTAGVPEDGAWLAALPAGLPPRRLPGRRHGPGQDGPGAGNAARAAGAARRRATPPPSLAVVPRSLVFNWIEEAKRFTPKLRVLDYTGLQRGALSATSTSTTWWSRPTARCSGTSSSSRTSASTTPSSTNLRRSRTPTRSGRRPAGC